MPVVPFIPAIIGAGASIGGAAIASHGATSAAKTQTDQLDRALGVQREIFDLQRADNAPYRQAGVAGLRQLSALLGVPLPAEGAPKMKQAQGLGGTGTEIFSNVPRQGGIAGFVRNAAQQQAQGQSPQIQGGSLASLTAGGAGLVTMRAPNGATTQVPQDQVAHYQQLGAQVVPGAA